MFSMNEPYNLSEQIEILNKKVIWYCTTKIIHSIVAKIKYLYDISNEKKELLSNPISEKK